MEFGDGLLDSLYSSSVSVGLCGVYVAPKVPSVKDDLYGLVEMFPGMLLEPFARVGVCCKGVTFSRS